MCSRLTITGLLLIGLSGCQCCLLTNPYANAIDCISDHEHHFERFYCPAWDLNRIGRADWCSYPINRRLCGCACNRMRPPQCGYVTYQATGVIREQVSHPDWSAEQTAPPVPTESPSDQYRDDIPPLLDADEAEKDLLLP